MKKQRVQEACKTVAMLLLLLSVAFLALTAVYLSGSADTPVLSQLALRLSGEPAPPPLQAEEPTLTDASQPLLISVCTDTGRASFWRDFSKLDSVYEALGSRLAAALDTAAEPEEIRRADFEEAAKQGVYFVYPGEIPLSILATWLDANASQLTLSGDRFLLTAEDGAVFLLVGGSGGYWRMATQVDTALFQEALAAYPADGSQLAMESEDAVYRRLDPLALVDPSVTEVTAGSWSNPCDETFLKATATTLGFNPYGDSNYLDDRGGTVYTETDCSLRIGADGTVNLRNQGLAPRFSAESADDKDRIEYVRALIQTLGGGVLGDARLYFTGLQQDGELTTVEFSYVLSGLEVVRTDGPAVTAEFSGAVLSELVFRVRTYSLDLSETLHVMPAAQTAAVARQGATLQLAYADTGESRLEAGWLR